MSKKIPLCKKLPESVIYKSSRNWIFTLNNYTDNDIEELKKIECRCIIFGKEIAPLTLTPHLQGCIVFNTIKSFKQVKLLNDKCRFESMICPLENNISYCKKDTDYICIGDIPISKKTKGLKGKESAINIWGDFDKDIISGMSKKDLVLKYPKLYGCYKNGFDAHFELFKPKMIYDITKIDKPLYEWQNKFLELIKITDDRKIIWVYGKTGNEGKTSMSKHMISCLNYLRCENGKSTDIAHMWQGQDCIFDLSRSQEDHLNYSIIESIKNGLVFSGKYDSCSKAYKIPQVIVFANFAPDTSKLSIDRWDIWEINKTKDMKYICVNDLIDDTDTTYYNSSSSSNSSNKSFEKIIKKSKNFK